MNIHIYQINKNRDTNNVCFLSYHNLEKWQGTTDIDSSIYDKVFSGNVECSTLEAVYEMFNVNHPTGYKSRSLSKSDIVEIVCENSRSEFYYCDTLGFQKVDFEPKNAKISSRYFDLNQSKSIKVLYVPVGNYPKEIEISNTYDAMKFLVGGSIEEYMPFDDDIAIICAGNGKKNHYPLNRAIYSNDNNNRELFDIIAGNFFVCYATPESEYFMSLPDDLMKKYKGKFKNPERFFKDTNGNITVETFKPKSKDLER